MMKLVETNNRRFSRNQPEREIEAVLMVGGKAYPTTVLDYSLRGVSLRVENGAVTRAESGGYDIELELQDEKYLGKIKHTRPARYEAIIGVDLKNESSTSQVSFTTNDPGWDLIEDSKTLATLFGDLAVKGPECPMDVRQIQFEGVILPQKIEEGILTAEVFSTKRGQVSEGTASFRFEIFQTCHAFDAKIVTVAEKTVSIELPNNVARLLRRETFRVQNGANEKTLKVGISSPVLGECQQELRLYDYSEHGISVIDPSGWLAAPIGFALDSIQVTTPDGKEIKGSGVIRGYRWLPEENDYAIGIGFETVTPEDRTNWHNTILEARYPTLSFDYRKDDHKPIWDLLDRSGYLGLKGPETFTHVFDVSKSTWQKMSDAGTKFSKRALIKLEGQVVGHLQLDRIYPKTWCAHTLAIDPNVSKTTGRDVYAVSADVLLAEGAGYVFSLADSKKAWNQRNYYDFIKNYRYPEHNELKIFQLYEVDLSKDLNLRSSSSVTLKRANQYDLRRIARYYELYVSPLDREACALNYEDLTLEAFNSELQKFGLFRLREFVVAMRDGKMLGFARIETGTTGVNIFGLLDMLYVHLMPDLGSEADLIHETLVNAGLGRLRDLGRQNVIATLEDRSVEYYNAHGLHHIYEGARWIGRIEVTKRYHAFSQMLYGHLLLKREEIRKRRR